MSLPASSVSGDAYKYCPYDNTHVILAKSFNAHLMKCRENHKGHKMVVCPLDKTHIIPRPELTHHLSLCDKRSLMDRDMQMRAGDNGLKGDVHGPPILGDRFAGDRGGTGEENWDDAPSFSVPTPALFNHKAQNPPDPYAIVPGGGYLPPTQREEPKIRKIPNAPAKAATLSHPAPVRPTTNQVFEFSVGNALRMPRADSNNAWKPVPAPNLGSGARMAGVRAPGADQGPRFIGRGISKYAAKGNQVPPASMTMTKEQSDKRQSPSRSPVPAPGQYEDNKTKVDGYPTLAQQQSQVEEQSRLAEEQYNVKQQQLRLQQGILQHQKLQLDQLKQQHGQQGEELGKKHQLQMLQLQKLQFEESQRLKAEQERQKQELLSKYAENESLMNSSSASAAGLFQHGMVAPGIIEAMMKTASNQSDSTPSADGQAPRKESVPHHREERETWHDDEDNSSKNGLLGQTGGKEALDASLSRLSVQSSNDRDVAASNNSESQNDSSKTRRRLEKDLKQIEVIEQKVMLGHRLSKEEETKLNSKDDIVTYLASLPGNSRKSAQR